MLELTVDINRKEELLSLTVVRIAPDTDPIEKGTICTYKFFINGEYSGVKLKHPYGDGISLAKRMFDEYFEIEG